MNPRTSATSRVRAVERPGGSLGALGHFDDAAERGAIADSEIGEDLAVDLDVGTLQAADELAVGHAVLASCCVDADDPQLTHLALALLSVPCRVGERVEECLARRLGGLGSGAAGPPRGRARGGGR